MGRKLGKIAVWMVLLVLLFSVGQISIYASTAGCYLDTTPPVINVPISSSYSEGDYYYFSNITVTDAGLGVDTVNITYDGSAVCATQSVRLVRGTHTIYVVAKDKAGNTAYNTTYITVRCGDTTPPTITIPVNSSYTEGDVYNFSNITVVDNGSGVDTVIIKYDGLVVDKTQSKTLTYGTHTIYVEARDRAGNTAYKTVDLNVNQHDDTTPPVITIPVKEYYETGENYIVNINITDNESGVDTTRTSVTFDGNSVYQGQSINLMLGTHTINVMAKDKAGNTAFKTANIYVRNSCSDTTPPEIYVPVNSSYKVGDYYYFSNIQVTDDSSGIESKTITYDGTTVSQSDYRSLTYGTHTIYVTAKDRAGNTAYKTVYIYVTNNGNTYDTTPPEIYVPVNSSYNVGDYYYFSNIQVTDNSSGVESVTITYDGNTVNQSDYRSLTYGTHTIYVTAKDRAGNTAYKTVYIYITNNGNNNGDTTSPNIYIPVNTSYNEGDYYYFSNIQVTDNGSGVDTVYITYDGSTVSQNESRRLTYGTHTIYVMAKDRAGNTAYQTMSVYVRNNNNNSYDTTPPYINIYTSSGYRAGDNFTVNVSVTDSQSSIDRTNIRFDGSIAYQGQVIRLTSGTHTIYVESWDTAGNKATKDANIYVSNNGTIVYPGAIDDNGFINDDINSLKLEIRNAGDRIKFGVDEEITYYIDYYNGTRNTIDNAEVTFYVPDNFTVVNASQGRINNNQVVWGLGTLQPLQSGRVQVRVKCTYSTESEKTLSIKADIRQNNTIQDTSYIRNMIFKYSASGYHSKYVSGYRGNVFLPKKGITRGELAVMMVRLFNINNDGNGYYSGFSDVKRNVLWSYDAIVIAANSGLFEGYPDGTFKPEKVVTRAEFAQVLARQLKMDGAKTIWIHYDDLRNHWSRNAMEQMARLKIIEGYSDSYIRPDQKITRSEAVTMLNRYTFRGALNTSSSTFHDVGTGNWAFGDIEEAARNHNYTRTSQGDEQ